MALFCLPKNQKEKLVMKQLAKLLSLIAMLCIICACFTACEMHTHEYQYSVTKEATCEFSGISYGYCSCGKTDEKVIPALGHTFKNDVCSVCGFNRLSDHVHTVVIDEGLPATCESIGLTEGSHCSACNMIITKQEVIPALGHLFMKYTQDNNATCTQDGTKTAVCDREGCNVTDVRVDKDSKKPHSYTAVTVPATCTTAGYVLSTCVCGDKTQEIIPATGHSFTNYVSDNNATCAQNGTKTAICDNSGCSERKTVTDENTKTSHKYTSTTVAPTCVAKGYTLYLCACGDSYMGDYVNTIAHVYNQEVAKSEYLMQEATCKAPAQYYKSCSCGKAGTQSFVYGGTLSHAYSTTWSYSSTHHWYEATCGCDAISRYEMHNSVNGFCSICGIPTESTVGVMYDLSADGTYAEVIGYTGTDKRVVIASEYQGKLVTHIYEDAFNNNDNITEIIFPETLLTIGSYAFYDCDSLTSVVIGDSVTSIGYETFYFCRKLTSIVIGDSVTSIGSNAFYYCSSLTSVVIGDSVTSIGSNAFYQCYNLTSVVIPDSVTSIGSNTFWGCSKLKFNEYENCKYIGSATNPYFALIEGINSNLSSITIHNDAKIIADYAFHDYARLTSVVIGDSVTSIGYDAFYKCSSLTNIYITNLAGWCNVTGAGNLMCYGSSSKNLYVNNEFVTELVIPDSVTSIGDYAFYYCSSLTSVVIGDSVTSIGYVAFNGCSSLTSVVIPNSVTSIVSYAFSNCSSLSEVNYLGTIDQWAEIEFDGYYANPLGYAMQLKINGEVVTEVNLTSTTKVSKYAFSGCRSLTSVVIGDSVTSIGSNAFYYCSSLTSVVIGDSVTSIDERAFYGCSGLTSVVIGDSVTSIGERAFYDCSGLTSIRYRGTQVQWNAIIKGSYWNYNTGRYTITCNYTGE